ncbi:MAG TPA: tryptophan-rich sensory protein [Roseiflexaceae bacterium]|nr:tryptophan-rich sensory protein [Roseiflexaceae bacterium]
MNIGALVAVLLVNWLANALPLNGKDTGQLSDQYPILTVPAGYAFAIWSLIYLGLIGFAVYQSLPSQRDNPRIARITPLFLVSCLANIGWLFTWHYEILSLNIVLMLVLLGSLIGIYGQLRAVGAQISTGERWFVWAPFSIYLGWITVATIVNLTVVLYAAGWQDTGTQGAALAALLFVVAAVIAVTLARRFDDTAYALVVVWALVAVAIKQAGVTLVAATAWVVAAVVALVVAYTLVKLLPGGRAVVRQE